MYIDIENVRDLIDTAEALTPYDIIKMACNNDNDEDVCAFIQLGLIDHDTMINLTKQYGVSHTVKEEVIEHMYTYSSKDDVDKCCRNASYSTYSVELIRTIVKYGSINEVRKYVASNDNIVRRTIIDRFPVLVPVKYLLDAQASNDASIKIRLINSGLFIYDLSNDSDECIAEAAEMYLNKKGGVE